MSHRVRRVVNFYKLNLVIHIYRFIFHNWTEGCHINMVCSLMLLESERHCSRQERDGCSSNGDSQHVHQAWIDNARDTITLSVTPARYPDRLCMLWTHLWSTWKMSTFTRVHLIHGLTNCILNRLTSDTWETDLLTILSHISRIRIHRE